jgi:hypothetical protein
VGADRLVFSPVELALRGLAFAATGYAQIERPPTGCTASCQTVGSTYSCNAEGASANQRESKSKARVASLFPLLE